MQYPNRAGGDGCVWPPRTLFPCPSRMNIHEHQGKELLRRYGVAVPDGQACFTVDEAVAAAERLGFPCVVKAQLHAGGRGNAGGVKIVRSAAEARAVAEAAAG